MQNKNRSFWFHFRARSQKNAFGTKWRKNGSIFDGRQRYEEDSIYGKAKFTKYPAIQAPLHAENKKLSIIL